MLLISLRGNLNGDDAPKQNKPYQINEVLKTGMHCWVDVWWKDDTFYLGTTEPLYPVKPSFIKMYSIWANAMNFETLLKLAEIKSPHHFCYRGEPILSNSGHIITNVPIVGYESSTVLLIDNEVNIDIPYYGIVSDSILNFASV